jgi:hypothetical protein
MVSAWRNGDFAAFAGHVNSDRAWWLRKGCYTIIMERTKLFMFRNLFRVV